MRRLSGYGFFCLLATFLPGQTSVSQTQNGEFQQIVLAYRDGHFETFRFGLAPFVIVGLIDITVVFLKDKQVVPRNSLRAICRTACPAILPPANEDLIVWEGRKPVETRGSVASDPSFSLVQNGRLPVKNATFDRVILIRFAE